LYHTLYFTRNILVSLNKTRLNSSLPRYNGHVAFTVRNIFSYYTVSVVMAEVRCYYYYSASLLSIKFSANLPVLPLASARGDP